MLCSFQELGIEEKYVQEEFKHGIYVMDQDAPVGADPLEYLGLNDWVFDLHLTPNRADMLSMIGVAYDLATVLDTKVKLDAPKLNPVAKKNPVEVSVEITQDISVMLKLNLLHGGYNNA